MERKYCSVCNINGNGCEIGYAHDGSLIYYKCYKDDDNLNDDYKWEPIY